MGYGEPRWSRRNRTVIDQASAAWVGAYRATSALANECSVPGQAGRAAVVEVGGCRHQPGRGQLVAQGADVRQQPVPVVDHQHPAAPRPRRLGQVAPFLVGHVAPWSAHGRGQPTVPP